MNLIFNGPENGPLFVFSHGAGAPLTADFMEKISLGLAEQGIRVARFNFNYMQIRVDTGSRRPPERATKLLEQFNQVIEQLNQPMVIGGKSMGGRMASLVAAQLASDASQLASDADSTIKGIACLGFPFHPIGKPEKLRTEHFPLIKQDVLIIQGDRDKLGSQEEVQGYDLPESIKWLWLKDGDHDLKPLVKSGYTHKQHLQTAIDALARFIKAALK
jgi:predicted alpha/beta-hydrolase family hydrolase